MALRRESKENEPPAPNEAEVDAAIAGIPQALQENKAAAEAKEQKDERDQRLSKEKKTRIEEISGQFAAITANVKRQIIGIHDMIGKRTKAGQFTFSFSSFNFSKNLERPRQANFISRNTGLELGGVKKHESGGKKTWEITLADVESCQGALDFKAAVAELNQKLNGTMYIDATIIAAGGKRKEDFTVSVNFLSETQRAAEVLSTSMPELTEAGLRALR